jgi:hypothetical protein
LGTADRGPSASPGAGPGARHPAKAKEIIREQLHEPGYLLDLSPIEAHAEREDA